MQVPGVRIPPSPPSYSLKIIEGFMVLSAKDEASYMLDTFKDWKICYNTVVAHVNAIQSRQQTLLTLATLTLTITGFSGPSMAASNIVSKYSMIFGISYFIGTSIQKIKRWLKQKRRK